MTHCSSLSTTTPSAAVDLVTHKRLIDAADMIDG
jgi:hypothetical protein